MFKAGLQQDRLFELPLIAGVSAVNVHWSVCSRFTAVMKDSVDDSDATLNIFSLASGHLYERFLRYNTLITMSCYCIRMYSLLLWNSGLCSRHICFLGMPCHHWKTVSEAFCIRSVSLSVSESVRPVNHVNAIFQKPVMGISPNFGHRCTWVHGCADQILGQKVKGQGHSRRRQ